MTSPEALPPNGARVPLGATRTMRGRVYVCVAWPPEPGDVVDWVDEYGKHCHRVSSARPRNCTVEPHLGDGERGWRVPQERVLGVWRRRTDVAA